MSTIEYSDPTDVATTELPEPEFVLDASEQSELQVILDDALNHGEIEIESRDDDPDGDHPDWESEGSVDWDADPLEHVIEDLVDGEGYSVRVRSTTEDVTGDWVTAEEITKLVAASSVAFEDVDRTSMRVTWTDESDFRGSYQIWLARTDYDYEDDLGVLVKSVEDDAEQAVVEGLQPDREYDVVVRAQTQWVRADADTATVTMESLGLETSAVPPSGPYVEIHHPDRDAPLTPDPSDIQKQPTVNGFPRIEITIPYDERWHSDALRDADIEVWIDGVKQPIDRVEHRKLEEGDSTKHTVLECRGGLDLENRVIEDEDIVEALPFVEYLIEEYTDYEAVVDDPEEVVREDVVVQLAQTLAELQAAFEEIPDDIPLQWVGDGLEALQSAWLFEAEDGTGTQEVSDDDYSGGEGAVFLSEGDSSGGHSFETDYTIPAGEGVFAARGEVPGSIMDLEITIDGQTVTTSFSPSGSLGWSTTTIDFDLDPGSHTLSIDGYDAIDGSEVVLDVVGVVDDRYDFTWDNEVNEPGGFLDGPEPIPDVVRLLLEEIATPLSITKAYLDVTTDDGEGIELSIGKDGTDDWDTVQDSLEHSLKYDELAAVFQARVGLGRREGLGPRDETPRLGYESRRLESIEARADLDETPVLVDFDPDDKLVKVLREVMDIADSVFEVRPGTGDGLEVHVTRIDGRPTDVDPDLINYSVDRQTEDTIDRAIIYAAAETIRRLPFEADVDEWTDLPLNEGRIVSGSVTIFDATDDEEESLERGEDYEIRRNVADGPPQIKLLTNVAEPRLECDFKPRGDYTREGVDEDDADTDVFDAPELNSQQMADIAAFQAVEGAYTLEVIEAEVTVPLNAIGWELADALNVAGLPGDDAFQVLEEGTDPSQGVFRLGAGKTGDEVVSEIRQRTQRVSQRV